MKYWNEIILGLIFFHDSFWGSETVCTILFDRICKCWENVPRDFWSWLSKKAPSSQKVHRKNNKPEAYASFDDACNGP